MANSNGWGDGAANNSIGWGQGANNNIGWGDSHSKSWAGLTDIVGIDSDAQAFITAAAITDPIQINAINTLVKDMKTDGTWTKMKAVYPFVGGTASTHKYNLKDPRDLDNAFRLVFNGGWTHSSTGATPNGTNGWAYTKLTPNHMAQNSAHMSIYNRLDSAANMTDMGCTTASSSGNDFQLISRFTGNLNYSTLNTNIVLGFVNTSSIGLKTITRTSSTEMGFFNNTTKTTITQDSVAPNNIPIAIGARNLNNISRELYSNRPCAFASIGNGLTDTEAANLYTRVQAFQTSLSRQV